MSVSAAGEKPQQPRIRAKRSLGQHFLRDSAIAKKIVDATDPRPGEVAVEVGPGTGALTRALAIRFGRVIAVEIDSRLSSLLQTDLSEYSGVHIVMGDVRDFAPEQLLAELPGDLPGKVDGYKVVGNLPYFVASPIIRHFLESDCRPTKMVVMVQKEVAENMVAKPGRTGLLSLAVQVYGAPRIVTRVPASKFHPKPKVESAVVAIDVYPEPLVSDPTRFFSLARAGFRAPRKQLHNSLVQGLEAGAEVVKTALECVGIDGRRRPATLTIEEWDTLSEALG